MLFRLNKYLTKNFSGFFIISGYLKIYSQVLRLDNQKISLTILEAETLLSIGLNELCSFQDCRDC